MMLPYSKFDLTKLLNKVLNIFIAIYSIDRLISLKIPFAFLWTYCLYVMETSTRYLCTLLNLSHIQLIKV